MISFLSVHLPQAELNLTEDVFSSFDDDRIKRGRQICGALGSARCDPTGKYLHLQGISAHCIQKCAATPSAALLTMSAVLVLHDKGI